MMLMMMMIMMQMHDDVYNCFPDEDCDDDYDHDDDNAVNDEKTIHIGLSWLCDHRSQPRDSC